MPRDPRINAMLNRKTAVKINVGCKMLKNINGKQKRNKILRSDKLLNNMIGVSEFTDTIALIKETVL